MKQVLARDHLGHADFSHVTLAIVCHVNVPHLALVFLYCIANGCTGGRYFPTGAMFRKRMLSGFDLRVRPAVQAFQIHAREIGVIFVQIVPLADSARLARDGVTHEALADISHLFSGFARNVKRFVLVRGHYQCECQCQCRCIYFINFFEKWIKLN
jgi:hypothetical protein